MSKSSSSPVFSVKRQGPELVTPAKPTPRESIYVSDIDGQQSLLFQIPFIMFYPARNPPMKGKDPVMVIKDALSKALVYYYPFAGRIREGPNQKLFVDCTGEGVLFIEADADITLDQLGHAILPPFPFIEELLFDVSGSSNIVGCPLLLIQVTRLMCGGFIFAVRLNHVMADSLGLVQFFKAIAEIAKGADKPSLPPVWKREIFTGRNPPNVTCLHPAYDKVTHTTAGLEEINMESAENLVQRCFFFGPKEIRSIRSHLPPHLRSGTSTFDVLTSCLWRSRTVALELNSHETVRVSWASNARINRALQVPAGYYGNAFTFIAAVSSAEHLCKNPLGYALELVKKKKTQIIGEEYLRSFIDLMSIKERSKCDTSILNLVVVDARAGFEEVDFGWGEAVYGGVTGNITFASIFSRARNSEGEEGIVVPIWLPPLVMERFEQELQKMTREAVDDSYSQKYKRIPSKM
ncbi:hypothetical protein SLE2022_223550 [Rubroshorea leprosula]